MRATWSGPSVASMPNSTMVRLSSTIENAPSASTRCVDEARWPWCRGASVAARRRRLAVDSPDQGAAIDVTGMASHLLHRVAQQRAGHAVPAAPALAQLEAGDLDDLDACLSHLGDRVGVALVGDDDTGLEGDDVVAVVPLLALLLVLVTAGFDDGQLVDAERVGDRGEEVGLRASRGSHPRRVPGRRLMARMSSTTFGYAVALSRSSSVKTVSRCMWARSFDITQAMTRSAAPAAEEGAGDLLDHAALGALAHPDEHGAVADRHDVAPLERRQAEVDGVEASVVAEGRVPELEGSVPEHRVRPVDRGDVVGLTATSRPVHRVDRHAAVDPAGGVAREQRVRQGGRTNWDVSSSAAPMRLVLA